MNVVGFGMAGVAEMLILLGLGGGGGLPLGIPPAPEDPLMASAAPDECLFYTTWAGIAEPDPNSENHTEQLLAEPEVQHLIAELERRIKMSIRGAAERADPQAAQLVEDAADWVKTLLTHPTMLFVSSVKMGPEGPDVQAGALVRVGEDAAKLKASLEKYQATVLQGAAQPVDIGGQTCYRIKLDPKAPVITWGVKGSCFIVGVGEGAVEGILARALTPVPEWLTEVRKQLPVDRTATVTYVNVKTIINNFVPLAGPDAPKIQAALDAMGLADVTSLASVTGLDKEGFVSKTLVGLSGEPRGVLSFAAAGPLGPDDLAPIPRDATIALAARLDAAGIFETILSVAGNIEPRARQEILNGLEEIKQEVGIDVRGDVLKPLGDTWCVYNSPGEGGLVVTGLTAVVQVKDRQTLAAAHAKLLAALKAEFGQDDERRRGPRIEQFQFAGQDIYFFNAREREFPLAPAWCLTQNELIVATFPQNIKAYLSRGAEFQSLAAVAEVSGLLQPAGGPVVLAYTDMPKLFELFYPLVPMFAQMITSELGREGIDIDISILPSAPAVGRHLRPSVAVVRRSPAGIEIIAHQTLPGGSIGATLPMTAFAGFPAVYRARAAARRVHGANNLKQIGLAMLNHDVSFRAFPAAYSTDEDGKPLLSWRVQILPYLEQKPLYDRFRLDEPWDSPHNKQLIPLMPQLFKPAGSNTGPGMTNYLTVRGKDTAFPGKEKIKMADIRDGTSNTIMVVEASDPKAVIWTKPDDFEYDERNPVAGLVGLRQGGFNAAFCDGSVHFISAAVDPDVLKRLFTRNDGQVVDWNELDPDLRRAPRRVGTNGDPAPVERIERAVEEEPAAAEELSLPRP